MHGLELSVKTFEERYKQLGGLKKLTELRALHCRRSYISNHFKVSQGTVRMWMRKFFGDTNDLKDERHEAIIESMYQFATNNGKEEVILAFGGTKHYPALNKLIKERKLYENRS